MKQHEIVHADFSGAYPIEQFFYFFLEALRLSLPMFIYALQMESLIAFFNSRARVSLFVSRSSSRARRRSWPCSRAGRSLRVGTSAADPLFWRLCFATAMSILLYQERKCSSPLEARIKT